MIEKRIKKEAKMTYGEILDTQDDLKYALEKIEELSSIISNRSQNFADPQDCMAKLHDLKQKISNAARIFNEYLITLRDYELVLREEE